MIQEPVEDKDDNSDNTTSGDRARDESVATLLKANMINIVLDTARRLKPIILAPLNPDAPLNGPR